MLIDSPDSVERDRPPVAQSGEIVRLEAVLQSHQAVFEAVVRERIDRSQTRCLVAYVKPVGWCTQQMLLDHLAKADGLRRRPDCIVLVSAIPRDAEGSIDEEALRQFEVVDDTSATELERTLLK